MIRHTLLSLALCGALIANARATPDDDLVRPVQERWAEIKYRNPAREQADQYHQLAQQARKISEANPNVAAALIWEGIVVSSEAGARGGLGALSLAKDARRLLEESLKLDEGALQGSAYTSLATLYAKVPGWPIGFGDDERAEELFRKSLSLNPDGIDANFFYGEYLIEEDRIAEGRAFLEKALLAPPRPGREVADQGRREEVQALLKKIGGASR
jgi:tetratricopeptide (TPR) repeat protein